MAIQPNYNIGDENEKPFVDIKARLEELSEEGFVLLSGAGPDGATSMIPALGEVVGETDVEVDEDRPGMVTNRDELDVHTDHGGVDYIVWVCEAQAEEGGESLLVDGKEVLEALDSPTREALREVYLTEHQVFPNDPARRPLLRGDAGDPKLYYSFWLVEDDTSGEGLAAYHEFRDAVAEAETQKMKLQPGDVLIVDNTRTLHGRTAIEAESDRCLKRYWIKGEAESERKRPRFDDPSFELPDPISAGRIEELKKRGVEPSIAEIDLSMVKMKLQEPDEGKGWSEEDCEIAELEYKRYLTLNLRYETQAIVPTKQIDDFWHYHILDTRAYHRDCDKVFGEYFHHFPYFGMRGEDDEQNLKDSFFKTVDLYEEEFGESMLRNEAQSTDCWHDCQGRCWNACSD